MKWISASKVGKIGKLICWTNRQTNGQADGWSENQNSQTVGLIVKILQ